MRGKVSLVRGILGWLLLVLLVLLVGPAAAEVKLPGFFTDHMVLERDVEVPVWGWANPAEKVTVKLGGQEKTVTACEKGKWTVKLDAMKAGGPFALTVAGTNTITIEDVLVGEVWVCSGQSNMAMTVSRAKDFDKEQAAADHPQIRMVTIARTPAETPMDDCTGQWLVCSPETVGGFSATAYFFGRTLHKELEVPVGLINSSWGGTPVQAWTCLKCQQALPELKSLLESWEQQIANYDAERARAQYEKALAAWKEKAAQAKAAGKQAPRRPRPPVDPRLNPHRPANLYRGMIAPLVPYAIRGGIWYQGESNAGRYDSTLYGLQLCTMIANWRKVWNQGDFPFLWVQLPNFKAPQQKPVETDGWVIVQEEMLKSLALKNTGMAVTIDVGEANDIHPKNKQEVGRRLALWALGTTYGKDLVYSGPLYKSASNADGKIAVRFEHVGDGLKTRDGAPPVGFAIAGPDKQFVWAEAKIEGKDIVVVSSPEVQQPAAVRYAWAPNPKCNLVNSAGLPASPFRTDDWKLE